MGVLSLYYDTSGTGTGICGRMTHEIEMIFHENPDSALLFWVLSFLEEEYYNNSAHKLRAIAHWVMSGCVSPYLYLEAYDLISHDPYLLTKLGRFEVRILRWGNPSSGSDEGTGSTDFF